MHRIFVATLLVSTAAIGFEILLMRVLSIVQWHHFAYMIISVALLGYGTSGTAIALNRRFLENHFETAFSVSALLFSASIVISFVMGQLVPFNALEIVWDASQLLLLGVIYLVFFVPFFFAACAVGLALTCRHAQISRVYFFDLLGAGLGAVLIIGALYLLSPQNAAVLLSGVALTGAVVVALGAGFRRTLVIASLVWLGTLAAGVPQEWMGLRLSEYKGLSQALSVVGSRALEVRSSPLGLLTVVDSPRVPLRDAPGLSFATVHVPPAQLGVYTDGDALSAMTRFDGRRDSIAYLGDVTAALPFHLLDRPRMLVLGAGGGSDILLGLRHGARHVDAVELNSQMIRLVGDTYADFTGQLYSRPDVSVQRAEARGFVTRNRALYDLIHIGLLDSFGAAGAGVQSLNESYIYTVEALEDYLEDTAPGGIVAITRWLRLPPRDSLKLFGTAIQALRRNGVTDPGRRLAMIRSWNTTTLIVKNGVLSTADIEAIREFAKTRSFDVVYFPGIRAGDANRYNLLDRAHFYEGAIALLGDDASNFMSRYKFHIAPASDERPYYFHFFKWQSLPEVFALRKQGGAGLIEWGYLILVAVLVQAVVAAFVLILLPLVRTRRSWPVKTGIRAGAYFFLLGLAFLFVEIAFIQKFILFLSHPLYAIAVVLSAFLVFAGFGSAFTGRAEADAGPLWAMTAALAVAAIAGLYLYLLPVLFDQFIGAGDALRIGVSVALIAPLAFFMGMPFPVGLRELARIAPDFIPWAWGINGFASVLSSALATVLAIEIGFSAVVVIALLLYLTAGALLQSLGGAAGHNRGLRVRSPVTGSATV